MMRSEGYEGWEELEECEEFRGCDSSYFLYSSNSSYSRDGSRSTRLLLRRAFVSAATLLVLSSGCGPSEAERLREEARSENPEVRETALRRIADLEAGGAKAIPDLLKWIDDADPDVRRLCCLALGKLSSAQDSDSQAVATDRILSALEKRLTDDATSVKMAAAYAVLSLQEDHADAQAILIAAMKSGDGGVIDRIGKLSPAATWAVPTLIERLKSDRRPGIRRLSAVALGRIAPGDAEVRAALEAARKDSDDRVRGAAGEALKRVGR